MISGRTALYGLVGYPVTHSLSPAMHNAAFASLRLQAAYVCLPVEPERLFEALRGAHALGFQGLNVTVPHKRRAAEICLSLDPVAKLAGAVNTLRRVTDGWEGFNTDAPATLALLEAAGVRRGARALLVGAGGAARAGAWALIRAGASVQVAARRPEAAAELCQALLAAMPGSQIVPVPWDQAVAAGDACDVLVNATTIGLSSHPPEVSLPSFRLHKGLVVVDYVYGDTAFVRSAGRAGCTVVTGEHILVRQGALAFSLWTGQPAPEAVMTAALRTAAGAH